MIPPAPITLAKFVAMSNVVDPIPCNSDADDVVASSKLEQPHHYSYFR